MHNGYRKFFESDVVYLISTIVAAVTMALYAAFSIWLGDFINGVFGVMYTFCVLFLYISYKKHEKNPMKFIQGVLLGVSVIATLFDFLDSFSYNSTRWTILIGLFSVIVICIFINHIFLVSDHGAQPKLIAFHQTLITLFFILSIVVAVDTFMFAKGENVWYGISYLAFSVLLNCSVCVDTKIDTFKEIREEKAAE